MRLYQITAPTGEPVSVDEVKKQLNLTHGDDDTYLASMITGIRQQVEESECWIQILTAVWELRFDAFPTNDKPIVLPRPPVQSLSSIKYTDTDGTETTFVHLDNSPTTGASKIITDYKSPQRPERAEIWLAYQEEWPTDVRSIHNAIKVRFTCGFGDAADVPLGIKQWMLAQAAGLYKFREPVAPDGMNVVPVNFIDGLLDTYRARRFAGEIHR